jgi:hypothetical protein
MLFFKKTESVSSNRAGNNSYIAFMNNKCKISKKPGPIHVSPGLLHKGGITDVIRCDECGTVSLFEEAFEVKPCWRCGHRDIKKFKAIWNSESKLWNIFTWGRGVWIFH